MTSYLSITDMETAQLIYCKMINKVDPGQKQNS